ncbi:MAG: DUF87 domain-containing protein [Candidatus Pacearchaeota archaeon]|nr:DUF87 domain-containing protein [Candidatus Pacearchaeota archaeon]
MAYDIILGRDKSDKIKFGKSGLIYLGKGYVTMGQYTSLSNNLYMDVARSHVILVAGKRGSGKSYSLGVIAEELSNLPPESARNIAPIIFDTMGIFWTMKFKNEKEKPLLDEWKLETKELPVKVFAPIGKIEEYKEKSIPVDSAFALLPSELEAEDWILTFNISMTSQEGVLITSIITELKEKGKFTIKDIQKEINQKTNMSHETKNVAYSLFQAADSWGIFSKSTQKNEGTEIKDLVNPGTTSVIDLSAYSSIGSFNVRALVIGLVSRKLFQQRMDARKKEEIQSIQHGVDYLSYQQTRETPLVWLFIDECLTGETEIITSKNHTPLKEVIEKFKSGEEIKVLTYDLSKKEFSHKPIINIYEKDERKTIKLTTETGKQIKSTPEHRVLTRSGFASAFSVNEIGSPIIQHYSEDPECIKARILGHLFGDGWASEKTQSLGFSGKTDPKDLNKIKKDLSLLNLKSSSIYSRKTNSEIKNHLGKKIKVKGTSHSIHASFKAYRYFENLGILKGKKTLQPTKIPKWVKESNDKIKSEFLAALMGSDGQKITSAKNAKGDFNAIRFSFNKLEKLEKEAFEYAQDIKKLFQSLNIEISNISKKPGNIIKNGDKTIKILITLKKDIKNTIRFLDKVGYRYCTEKENEGIKWSSYLKARLFLKQEREKVYEKALVLQKKGLGKIKIAKELNFPEAQIRDWIYNKNKPGVPKTFPSFEEWTLKRIKDNILYEKVFRMEETEKERVYDISVDKTHNFVSNGLITHNCHEFLPKEGKTPATDALVQLLREGRQPGISLVLATQQPGQIHKDVMTQSDIVISHRVTAKPDIDALNQIMQSYLLESINKSLNNLPALKGSAIILDDNSERIYPMRIRPRFTWHGGEAPTAIKPEN